VWWFQIDETKKKTVGGPVPVVCVCVCVRWRWRWWGGGEKGEQIRFRARPKNLDWCQKNTFSSVYNIIIFYNISSRVYTFIEFDNRAHSHVSCITATESTPRKRDRSCAEVNYKFIISASSVGLNTLYKDIFVMCVSILWAALPRRLYRFCRIISFTMFGTNWLISYY